MSFLTAVFMLYAPVKKLNKLNNRLQKGLAATDRIFDILERQSDIQEAADPIQLPRQAHQVSFENLYFGYGESTVLNGINLTVEPGEIMALVGMSGGGKTSLVNLIPRFYDVDRGAVKIDGVDIRQISIDSLRSQIGIVTQEPILFNDSVKSNIAYGNPQASEEDIFEAARSAYAYDFIERFPEKFETSIGELGGRLSGGEKQRICIARALLKDAPILILDEATSALDTEAETLVQKALENLMQGRTTFVIAHRLSTVGHANRIAVIKAGKIVEIGTQEDLLEKKSEFYRLYTNQFNPASLPG
jgi:subfamily B ATP-binding cassette protein MsbA